MASTNYRAIAIAAARAAGINPSVFLRQINQESGFNPGARSPAGALGIAQFMPGTAAGYHINPMNPQQALYAAARMDAQNLHKYGDWADALSAYNSGRPYSVGKGIPETSRYVQTILGGQTPSVGSGGSSVRPGMAQGNPSGGGGGSPSALIQALLQSITSGQPFMPTDALNAMAQQRAQAITADQVFGPQNTGGSGVTSNGGTAPPGDAAGGFLPKGAVYKPGRQDQGRDFQTSPGGAIVAPGAGVVISVKSDPHGFGPAYPVVHFTSGPYAGKDIYIGHTISSLKPGAKFTVGTILSRTGTSPIGNASVPGWAEIGFAPGGVPGQFGQNAPFG